MNRFSVYLVGMNGGYANSVFIVSELQGVLVYMCLVVVFHSECALDSYTICTKMTYLKGEQF